MNLYRKFSVSFFMGGGVSNLEATCSLFGALGIKKEPVARKFDRELLLNDISVQLNGLKSPIQSYMVYEHCEKDLPSYHARFKNLNRGQSGMLKRLIDLDGFPAPWKRQFPRLAVLGAPQAIDIPILAATTYKADPLIFDVVNFTLNGLLVNGSIGSAGSIEPGSELEFELMYKSGLSVPGFVGKVVRTSIQRIVGDVEGFTQNIGIQLTTANKKSQNKFKNTIAQYCRELKL